MQAMSANRWSKEELKRKMSLYFPDSTHYENDGISSWSVSAGNSTIYTGDGGAQQLCEEWERYVKFYLDISKEDDVKHWENRLSDFAFGKEEYKGLTLDEVKKKMEEYLDDKDSDN